MLKLIRTLRDFAQNARGSMSVEAVFAFPLLLWAATATYTFFDAFRAQNAVYRANYTISDMLSRETSSVDANYINGLLKVFRYMTLADENAWIRVTVLHCVDFCDHPTNRNLDLDWSFGANGARALHDGDFNHYNPLVPLVAQGDRLVLVETSMHYKPPFQASLVSFPERDLVAHVTTRPRFAPLITWDHTYDMGSGGNHSDDSQDTINYDTDPDLDPDAGGDPPSTPTN